MFDYLEDIIVKANKDLKNSCLYYPENYYLFKVNYNSSSLPTKDAECFHCHVARLLFVSKIARPDIQSCIAFLCIMLKGKSTNKTRLQKTWKSYQLFEKKTVHLLLVVGVDDSGTLTWNIDASFTVYPDCKSHTRACLTLGHGSICSISAKQKINTKSSTETELVGVDDAMTFVMWMRHFFESQVQSVNMNSPLKPLRLDVTIEQDNTIEIQLERNGLKSSSKKPNISMYDIFI